MSFANGMPDIAESYVLPKNAVAAADLFARCGDLHLSPFHKSLIPAVVWLRRPRVGMDGRFTCDSTTKRACSSLERLTTIALSRVSARPPTTLRSPTD